MLISVESVFPEQTVVTIHLVFALVVDILKWMSTRRIYLEISFTILCHFSVIFEFVWTITFLTFWFICVTHVCGMFPLLTFLVLRNIRVHIYSSYSSNMIAYIETFNKTLCFHTILQIPNIDLYHSYIRFGRHLNNSRTRS